MLRSIRLRLTVVFASVLIVLGWIVSIAITHSSQLMTVYTHEAQQHHIRHALTIFMLLLFPAAAIGTWVLVGRTLKPLRTLSHQAEEFKSGRLVSPSSDIEMVELVTTINHLLDRIEATAEAKSQFYAAASHELRTPLQALNGHLETTLGKPRNEGEYQVALVEAQKQTQRLTTLTRDILLLHQLSGQNRPVEETADIGRSIEVVIQELSPLIEARSLRLTSLPPGSRTVSGRQSYADICIRNLVENAARYTPVAGLITISLNENGLEIRNLCEPDVPADLEVFFDPFAASKGVVGGSSKSGNGLGLAVCRAAAEANGWSVKLARVGDVVVASVSWV